MRRVLNAFLGAFGDEVGRELVRTGVRALREEEEREKREAMRRRAVRAGGLLLCAASAVALAVIFGQWLERPLVAAAVVAGAGFLAGAFLAFRPAVARRLEERRRRRRAEAIVDEIARS